MSASPFPRRTSSGRGHLLLQGQVSHSSRLVGPRWHVLCLPPILLSDARSNVRVSFLFILKFIFFLHSVPLCCLLASVKCILSIIPPYTNLLSSVSVVPQFLLPCPLCSSTYVSTESLGPQLRENVMSVFLRLNWPTMMSPFVPTSFQRVLLCSSVQLRKFLCFCSTLSIPPLWVPCVGSDLAVVCSAAVKSHTRAPVLLIWSLPRKCSGVWFQDLRSLCTDFISVWICPRPTNNG